MEDRGGRAGKEQGRGTIARLAAQHREAGGQGGGPTSRTRSGDLCGSRWQMARRYLKAAGVRGSLGAGRCAAGRVGRAR